MNNQEIPSLLPIDITTKLTTEQKELLEQFRYSQKH